MLPPDPLEVVHLEHEQGDDPEEYLGLRHVAERIGVRGPGAMGRPAQRAGCQVLENEYGAEQSPEESLRPEPSACR